MTNDYPPQRNLHDNVNNPPTYDNELPDWGSSQEREWRNLAARFIEEGTHAEAKRVIGWALESGIREYAKQDFAQALARLDGGDTVYAICKLVGHDFIGFECDRCFLDVS